MAFNYSPKIVTDGLVLYLDAANTKSYTSGSTTWNDISRGGNNGTLTNGPTFNSDNGGNIVFDGTDDFVNMGDKSAFTLDTGFTFALYLKPPNTGNSNLIEKYQATGFEYIMGILNSSIYAWVFDNTAGGYRGRIASSIFSHMSVNKWNYICFTYNGGTANTDCKVYVNGVQRDNSNFAGGNFTKIRDTPTPLTFGGGTPGLGSSTIKGSLANMIVYNRALSVTEILQNYNATKTRFGL